MKTIQILLAFLIIVQLVTTVHADNNTYYVSTSGNDSNDGLSPSNPWRTTTKVSSTINGGDTVLFKCGDVWTDTNIFRITKTGSLNNPTTISSYGDGEKPVFEGKRIEINGQHIKIEDISVRNTNSYMFFFVGGSNNIEMNNVEGKNAADHMIYFQPNCNNIIIRNCKFDMSGIGGNDIIFGSFSYGLIENNEFAGAKHSTINLFRHPVPQDEYVIIRNNNFSSPRRSLDIYTSKTLIEDNIFLYEEMGSIEASAEQFCGGDDTIIRNNYFLEGPRGFINLRMTYSADGTQYVDSPMERFSVYHNTFHTDDKITGTLYAWTGFITLVVNTANPSETNTIKDLIVKNNIMSGISSDNCLSMYYIWPDQQTLYPINNIFEDNILYLNENENNFHTAFRQGGLNIGGDCIFKYSIEDTQTNGWPSGNYNFDQWVSYKNNTWQNPLLDGQSISINSPAIDSGSWLTKTTQPGNSNLIYVENAQYFFPRISIANEIQNGDTIFVGDNDNLEVLFIDYQTNAITIDKAISYEKGEIVSLSSYSGSYPDIGAYEYEYLYVPGFEIFLLLFSIVIIIYLKRSEK